MMTTPTRGLPAYLGRYPKKMATGGPVIWRPSPSLTPEQMAAIGSRFPGGHFSLGPDALFNFDTQQMSPADISAVQQFVQGGAGGVGPIITDQDAARFAMQRGALPGLENVGGGDVAAGGASPAPGGENPAAMDTASTGISMPAGTGQAVGSVIGGVPSANELSL